MNRKQITEKLTEQLEKHINPHNDPRIYTAKEVTFDYSTEHPIRVDYMVFKPINNSVGGIEKGVFYCYEIKSCKEDLLSGHGMNFIGDYNYLVFNKGMFDELNNYVPYNVGVYELSNNCLTCVKKARLKIRERSVTEMLLMMFRSSNRELLKIKRDSWRQTNEINK